MADLLSVGIDIGTSTTQVIFSRLELENTSGYFSVPHVSIVDKEVVYKSDIHFTPLRTASLIDADKVRDIVAGEFAKAGYAPADTGTGAVIITGESARKENAGAVLERLSGFAGDFVVSTAGPDLEAIIAGKGSGAWQYSLDNGCAAVNLDIGGGTTNVVLFDGGDVAAKGCVDIGGRLIRLSPGLTVEKISPAAALAAREAGAALEEGRQADLGELKKVTDVFARLLEELMGLRPQSSLLRQLQTPGSTWFQPGRPVERVCFSGGVADHIYREGGDPFRYGDIGPLLGQSIRESGVFRRLRVLEARETIRATVVGAGTYATSISGSTISYTGEIFPLKNVPVLKLSAREQEEAFRGDRAALEARVRWFLEQCGSDRMILALPGKADPGYGELRAAASAIAGALDEALPRGEPILIVVEHDMAKALGQAVEALTGSRRAVAAIDSIKVEQNDYVDMGRPLMDGMVIPVVVKTLIFG